MIINEKREVKINTLFIHYEDGVDINRQYLGKSIFPPDITTPHMLPFGISPFMTIFLNPAKARQPVGSTIIFIRSAMNFISCISSSSVTVTIRSTFFFMTGRCALSRFMKTKER